LRITVKTLPVPLENLFFPEDLKSLPPNSKTDFTLLTDNTMGGKKPDRGNSDPNSNSFAWHIIDGPESEVATLDKRHGSDWELFDCTPEHLAHEGRQTAKMVCTDDSPNSNCHKIWLGEVPATVLKMPAGCGPGKYAMAVALDPIEGELPPPHINIRSARRGVASIKPRVYKLTFDYDFSILQKRAVSNVLLRIDYSDNPGYWAEVVGKSPPLTNGNHSEKD
jgi:chitinase